MKKWIIYMLGVITGIILTFALAFCTGECVNKKIFEVQIAFK